MLCVGARMSVAASSSMSQDSQPPPLPAASLADSASVDRAWKWKLLRNQKADDVRVGLIESAEVQGDNVHDADTEPCEAQSESDGGVQESAWYTGIATKYEGESESASGAGDPPSKRAPPSPASSDFVSADDGYPRQQQQRVMTGAGRKRRRQRARGRAKGKIVADSVSNMDPSAARVRRRLNANYRKLATAVDEDAPSWAKVRQALPLPKGTIEVRQGQRARALAEGRELVCVRSGRVWEAGKRPPPAPPPPPPPPPPRRPPRRPPTPPPPPPRLGV